MFGIESMSRFQRSEEYLDAYPGALPQAITFRAFGASETKPNSFFLRVGLVLLYIFSLRSHVRKKNHVADRLLVR